MFMNEALASAVGRLRPQQCVYLCSLPAKAVCRCSWPVYTTDTFVVCINAHRQSSMYGTWRYIDSSTLYGGAYRGCLPIPPGGVREGPMDAVSVEGSSRKWERSVRHGEQSSIVHESYARQRIATYTKKEQQKRRL